MSASRSSQIFFPTRRGGSFVSLQDLGVHPHDEHFLVVRTVEDADAPALGQVSDVAPHEVVVEFLRRRLLERGYLAPLRIDAGHDVFDRAVLAGRVHRLEDQQQGPAVLGVKHVLLFRQPRNAALEEVRGVALVQLQAAGVARIEVLQAEALAFGDAERVDVFLYPIEDFFSRHAPPPPFVKSQSTPTGSWAQLPGAFARRGALTPRDDTNIGNGTLAAG